METITVHALFGKAVLKDIPISMLHSGTYQPRDNFSEMLEFVGDDYRRPGNDWFKVISKTPVA